MYAVRMMPGQEPYTVRGAADDDPGEQDEPTAEWREIGRHYTRSDADKLLRWMYRGERGRIARGEPSTRFRVRHLGRGKGYAIDGLFRVID